MTSRMITAYFDNMDAAESAVDRLASRGISKNDINFISPKSQYIDRDETPSVGGPADQDIGVAGGVALGGATGLLVGLSSFLLPGIGPIVAAGPIAAGLAAGVGAVTGAIAAPALDTLTRAGLPLDEAQQYIRGLQRGWPLVSVRATPETSSMITEILQDCDGTNITDNYEGRPFHPDRDGDLESDPRNDATTAQVAGDGAFGNPTRRETDSNHNIRNWRS